MEGSWGGGGEERQGREEEERGEGEGEGGEGEGEGGEGRGVWRERGGKEVQILGVLRGRRTYCKHWLLGAPRY